MERFRESGLSVSEFCRVEGVSTPSFYQWRKRLAEQRPQQSSVDDDSSGFARVRVVGSASVSAQLPGGTRVEIPIGDAQALRLVVETLARVDAQRAEGRTC